MKPVLWGLLGLLIAATPAWAVEKCKDASGKTYYSDRGCVGGGEKVKGDPARGGHTIGTQSGDSEMARKCAEQHLGGTGENGEMVRVANYQVKTVAVKDVGPRRLVTVTAGLVGPGGLYYGGRDFQCLLRGDNVSFQTTPYQLVN